MLHTAVSRCCAISNKLLSGFPLYVFKIRYTARTKKHILHYYCRKNTVFLINNCINYTVDRDTDKLNRNLAFLHVEAFVRDKQLWQWVILTASTFAQIFVYWNYISWCLCKKYLAVRKVVFPDYFNSSLNLQTRYCKLANKATYIGIRPPWLLSVKVIQTWDFLLQFFSLISFPWAPEDRFKFSRKYVETFV